MKQKDLVKEMYKACVEHDQEKIEELRYEELQKILKHKEQGKPFNPKWVVTD